MKRPLLVVALIAVLAGAGWAWHHYRSAPRQVTWQGWVEGNFLFLAPDEAGRVVRLEVKEGDTVKAGAPLFTVQSDLQAAELEGAKAALSEATARLERAEAAQQRPEEVAVLEAQKARALAALDKSRPELARAQDLVAKGISPQSRLDDAISAVASDEASLSEIERQITVARLKSRSEDIAAARAVVNQARSRLAAAQVSLERRTVKAPEDARVQELFYRHGEVVPAGRAVLSLLPPGNVKLRFFVPETELATMAPGQPVEASCDGCARAIKATVTFVSTEAEFTPPVIFSKEERKKLVFRVEAKPASGTSLPVGLPVTVAPATEDSAHAEAER